jgi:aminopeptidase N
LDVKKNTNVITLNYADTRISKVERFDTTSDSEESSVIRMLVSFLSVKKSRKGLVRYIQAHKHGSVTTINLWEISEEEMNSTGEKAQVEKILTAWTSQIGHPVLECPRTVL